VVFVDDGVSVEVADSVSEGVSVGVAVHDGVSVSVGDSVSVGVSSAQARKAGPHKMNTETSSQIPVIEKT
jgi:hypothetical protein